LKVTKLKSEFGWTRVKGAKYEKDIIIHSDETITKREKKSKDLKTVTVHTSLSVSELDFLSKEKCDKLYIRKRHEGVLPITPEALKTPKSTTR